MPRLNFLNTQLLTLALAGLLHADHRAPSLDYETIMKATLYLTRDVKECEAQFRNAVFNILSHNRDDHSKNFSFLMDNKGAWSVSPAYDLTFSSGPGGEHSTMIMGEGKNPNKEHLLKLAVICNMGYDNQWNEKLQGYGVMFRSLWHRDIAVEAGSRDFE